MSLHLEGKIHKIHERNNVTGSFQKRECVIKTDEQYPQLILIEFHQNNTDLLDNYSVGMEVKISINLRGREWVNPEGESKYFNTIVGWNIQPVSRPGQTPEPPRTSPAPIPETNDDEPDDLPF